MGRITEWVLVAFRAEYVTNRERDEKQSLLWLSHLATTNDRKKGTLTSQAEQIGEMYTSARESPDQQIERHLIDAPLVGALAARMADVDPDYGALYARLTVSHQMTESMMFSIVTQFRDAGWTAPALMKTRLASALAAPGTHLVDTDEAELEWMRALAADGAAPEGPQRNLRAVEADIQAAESLLPQRQSDSA